MPFINVGQENSGDIELYYEDMGKGDPLVLIHGYPFSGLAWERMIPFFLDKGFRVITYDRRGFGKSAKPSIGYDFDTFAKDLNAIMVELELENVTLVGHSMGSGEVTRYISHYGTDRVKCGVLVSPLQPFLLKTAENEMGVDKKFFDDMKVAIVKDRYAFIPQFLKSFYNLGILNTNMSEEKLRADFHLAASSSPIAFLKCVDTWLTDFHNDLPKLKSVPILAIHGAKDQVIPINSSANLLPALIGCELKVIEGGPHGIPWTHADLLCHMIDEFITTSARRPRSKNVDRDQDQATSIH
jgi:non-heme chloroperoxidase